MEVQRVTLSDGKPLPARTELALGRQLVAKPMLVTLSDDGGFEVEGLSPEATDLMVRWHGYRVAPATPGYRGRWLPGIRIAMLRDRDDVQIVLDPNPPTKTAAGVNPRP